MGINESHLNNPPSSYSISYGDYIDRGSRIIKTYKLTSKQQQSSFQVLIHRYKQFNVPTILPIVGQVSKTQELTEIVCFKKLETTLNREIQDMSKNQFKYSEFQILRLIDCVLSALMAFRLKELVHGCINCLNIFVDYIVEDNETNKIYVIGLPLLLNSGLSQQISKKQVYHQLYLSPLNLLELGEGKERLSVCEKNQVFSLGLVVLKLATFCDIGSLYDFSKFTVNKNLLDDWFRQCTLNYSTPFCQMLARMISIDQYARPDFQKLYSIFANLPVENLQESFPHSPRQLSGQKVIHLNHSSKKKSSGKKYQNSSSQVDARIQDWMTISTKSRKAWVKYQSREMSNGAIIDGSTKY